MIKHFIASITALLLSTFASADENPIPLSAAKTFLEEKMRESFPGQQIVIHENKIVFKMTGNTQSICYSSECWPVTKKGMELIDLAAKTAANLGLVRVEFRYSIHDETTPKSRLIKDPSFALQISNVVHTADILRFLNGYRQYSPYHVKFAPKEDVLNDKTWIRADYFSGGSWIESAEIMAKYENVQFLEEIYDGIPDLLLGFSAVELRKHPFFKDGYAILSPWNIFPNSVFKDGVEKANLINKLALPPGPLKDQIQWKYAN